MASLKEYREKRRLDQTPEPAGEARPSASGGNRFVVQKHDARRLHYDFRLEIDGALKSWAVPKGPSLNPADKRLAMQTEDHPLDYAGFEGVIPEGHYGAGPVSVWDHGTFEAEGDFPAPRQIERGELKFTLHGQKLRGSFVLVKLRQPEQKGKGKPWLLIKHRDAFADPNWNIEEHDGSVLSGRVLSEIEQGLPPADVAQQRDPATLEGARRAKMPAHLAPMLATLAEKPFSNPDWLFEIKWDGMRALAWIKDGGMELRSRTGRIISAQYPELASLPERVRASEAILDGEVVVLNQEGRSDFERLQSRINVAKPSALLERQAPVTYYLFDLLYADGYDLRQVPLLERKQLLKRLLDAGGPFRYADHQAERGKELFELAQEQGLEGIVGKHLHSAYSSIRSPYWVKFKVTQELEAVVGGWTAPRGSREHFGALLLGLYAGKALRYIGNVGTGFTEKVQSDVYARLEKLQATRSPFESVPQTDEEAFWTSPTLVARVKYANWTEERRLRAPVFLGLLEDRNPGDCRLETEIPAAAATLAAPALAGHVLKGKEAIEKELFQGRAETISVEMDGRQLQFTNLNKVYFPESGYTKRDLLAYYYRMAEYVLPFLKDRPLVLRRYPNGITQKSFFQKEAGEAAPKWMKTVALPSGEKRDETRYFVGDDRAALLYLTNLGCIDHNPWSSRVDDLEHPDYVFFDLDPSEGTEFEVVVAVAKALYQKLQELNLTVYLKTSGATGLHMYLPVERGYTYEQLRAFADIVGRLIAAELPKLVTQERAVEKRPSSTVLIDAYQNASGRPLAAAYTVRAFPKAPVSAPIAPNELRRGLHPEQLNLRSIFARLEKHGNLWADFWEKRQRIESAVESLLASQKRTR